MNKSNIESPRTSVCCRLHIRQLLRLTKFIPTSLFRLVTLDIVELRKNKNCNVGGAEAKEHLVSGII